ncbi:hypothetical protein J3R82DRAFT_4471 [Butyriboletus roseoflavus]|nr:hypothetical protein J3R82DRAFT_4471 [Butyriboletus roseoflavus]
MAPIKTCVLGVGLAGLTFHIPFILALPDLFTLHAVLERNPQSPGGKVKERFGVQTKIYRTIEDVVGDKEIELVIVGTPNDTHYSLAKAALEAGKNVLVDKPVSETVAQARELDAIAKSKGLVLYGYQNRRWDSDHIALKQLLALSPSSPQHLGNLLEFESHYDRYRPGIRASWKDNAGAVYDLGAHLLDQALELFGRPAKITAFIQNIRGVTKPEVDDIFTIYLHYNVGNPFPNPFTVLLRSHILSAKALQLRYVVRGTKGVFTKYGLDTQEEQLKAMPTVSSIFAPGYGQEPQEIYGTVENIAPDNTSITKSSWPSEAPGQYIGLFRNLAGAIRDNEELEVKWAETTQVIEMIELAYKSSKEGRTLDAASSSSSIVTIMSVPTVVIHVELPAYSNSFNVQVPESATVLDVKQAISFVCIGHPRPEGQRVIWRGRCLDDQENISELWPCQDDQRTVHLSVRPSAWTSDPPSPDATTPPSLRVAPYPTKESPPMESQHYPTPSAASDLNDSLAFIRFQHSQALSWLSNSKLAAPSPLEDMDIKRSAAKLALERLGYTWPDILDATSPLASPTSADTLDYEIITIDGKSYLSLKTPRGTPSFLQVHALNVLTYTFSILSLPPSCPLPTPTSSVPNTPSVPPHVNDLLRELGLPPLRAVPNANIDATVQADVAGAPPIPEHAEGNVIREIPMRALIAPLLMVIFRTVLLLYFFSPTRKPILGLCLIAWIIYEMWTHVRLVILRPLDRAGGNGAGLAANGAQARDAADATPVVAPVAQDNNHAGDRNPLRPGGRVPNTEPTPDAQPVQGPPIPRQSNGIVDSLALANVHNGNKLLWPLQQPATIPEPPTFLHKAMSFFSLLVVTLHPEVYNRRRVALRQREGRLRTEMNAVEQGSSASDSEQVPSEEERRKDAFRQQLQTQHTQRAVWVKRYVERVRRDDWVEE